MVLSFSWIVWALCAGNSVAGSLHPTRFPRQTEGAVADFEEFARSYNLSEEQIKTLGAKYEQANTSAEQVEVACQTAQSSLGEAQVDTSPLNQTAVQENWSQTCWAQPACIIEPQDAEAVSTTIGIISFYQVKFAVRSGGHSPNPSWSSVGQDGILVSLDQLKDITLSGDGTYASVGPGAHWGDVYISLDPHEAVVVGGRDPSPGVGGLILGGITPLHHNLLWCIIVLSDGSIVDASVDSNPDLFWALKGGGPNFGIVTRYDLYTVPVYTIWAEILVFSTDHALELISAYDLWQNEGASDVKSSVAFSISLDAVILGLIYSEPSNDPPTAFDVFYDFVPQQVALAPTNTTFANLNQIIGALYPAKSQRHDYRGFSTLIDTNLTQRVYTSWHEKAVAVHNATGANQTFVFQHVGVELIEEGNKRGGNPLNLPLEDMQWWTATADWEDEADDELVRSVSIETTALWERLATERGVNIAFLFMNDASRDQDPLSTYGSASVARLREISQTYDPTQLFQTLQNGGFLLSKVSQ
ncbi:Bifunctional solanapyrone synthase 4 [Seiridium cupressi]